MNPFTRVTSRRVLARGAAWTVPAVTVAAAVPAFASSTYTGPCPSGNETGLSIFAADFNTATQTGLTITEAYNSYTCSAIGNSSFRVWTITWTIKNTSTVTIYDIQLLMPYMGTRYQVDNCGYQNTSCFTPTTYVGAGSGSYGGIAWWQGPSSVTWGSGSCVLGTYGYDTGPSANYDVGVGAGTGATMSYTTIANYKTNYNVTINTSASGASTVNPYSSTTSGSNTSGSGTKWSMCSTYNVSSTAQIPLFTPSTTQLAAGATMTFTTKLYMEGESSLGSCQRVDDNLLGVVLLANKCLP